MALLVAASVKLTTRSPQKLNPSALPQMLLIVSEIYDVTAIDLV